VTQAPLRPARIEWDADGTPRSPDYGDLYHARIGADAQARHVFLTGNRLPGRWADREAFTIAETGFGLGHNFLATWAAWRDDPRACRQLHYVAIEAHPAAAADLERAHRGAAQPRLAEALRAAWPLPVAGLHLRGFDEGRVRLLLAFGDVEDVLPGLRFGADAFYLDGFAPDRNPRMWQRRVLVALGRRARPGATAATWSVAREVRDGLVEAGFEVEREAGIGGKREVLRARLVRLPRHGPGSAAAAAGSAVVIGAGIAGACVARALAERGLRVDVLEEGPTSGCGASGNPAGLYHGTLHAADNPHARLFRAAALHLQALLAAEPQDAAPPGALGLLRLETRLPLAEMSRWIERQGLPEAYVQALPAREAARRAGVALTHPCWYYPGGGWLSPADFVARRLRHPAIRVRTRTPVAALAWRDGQWQALHRDGTLLAQAPALVVATAQTMNRLLDSAGAAGLPLHDSRGQVSLVEGLGQALRLPVAGDGYALPLPGGALLCGATTDDSDDDAVREADHQANFGRLQRLCGLDATTGPATWRGRVGRRVLAPDRLPVAGAVPLRAPKSGTRLDQCRFVPRIEGLHVAGALGGRGITLAPLLGEVVAAGVSGTPMPLEQDLLDAVDPARWLVRAARAAPAPDGQRGSR
jgi:tRNA 5-methylaminomethyl-2-thiouridine biosynthesis bifunctional protein